jgi:hypothetical protein
LGATFALLIELPALRLNAPESVVIVTPWDAVFTRLIAWAAVIVMPPDPPAVRMEPGLRVTLVELEVREMFPPLVVCNVVFPTETMGAEKLIAPEPVVK